MRTPKIKATLWAILSVAMLMAAGVSSAATTTVNLTAQRMSTTLPDGASVPMWGYCTTGSCTSAWAPGPTITVPYDPAGNTLQINLTNNLPVPTSIMILGQLGGGLGVPTRMNSPTHATQTFTTFVGNAPVGSGPAFTPPPQVDRAKSWATEVAAGTTTTAPLTWTNLQPGTYIYETATLPSLEVPMGLYGVLIVTQPPVPATVGPTVLTSKPLVSGNAYPNTTAGVAYDADATLLFSEIDPIQNAQVDTAAQASTDVNKRWNDPTCAPACYPAAVNYTPTYFLINGKAFDKSLPQNSAFAVGGSKASGNVLLRLLNAGSHTHIPTVVGLSMSLIAEDGNVAPGNPKIQNEVLLTASKTYDVIINPVQCTGASSDPAQCTANNIGTGNYAPNTFGIFDRQLSLTTANGPDGGQQGFLLVNQPVVPLSVSPTGYATGVFSTVATPTVVDDSYQVPLNTAINGNVKLNDIAVHALTTTGTATPAPAHGTLTFNADGTFIYTPTTGFIGTDTFTYTASNTTGQTATVTLKIASSGKGGAPTAVAQSYTSSIASSFSASRPGLLTKASDPSSYPLTASLDAAGTCGSVTVNPDGSFTATSGGNASCQFTYVATNSQGTASSTATATVTFVPTNMATGLTVNVVDASTGTRITDYRWTIQEDLTFKVDPTGTPSLSTRTLGTSFHRSHMPLIAAGCVGTVSCGSGQSLRLDHLTIKSITEAGTTVTVTTTVPHGLPDQSTVMISGVTPVGYNGTYVITVPMIPSPNTFTYTAANGLASGTGGEILGANGTLGARHTMTDAEATLLQTMPGDAVLDPTKNYYISILPGDAQNPVVNGGGGPVQVDPKCDPTTTTCAMRPFDVAKDCLATNDPSNPCGHMMGGAEIKRQVGTSTTKAWNPVSIALQTTPLVPAQLSVYIYEDNTPTNGQNDLNESGLGGFNVILFDPAGRTGDPAGQQTYDAFNMPLSNALLGRPGCPDDRNTQTNGTAPSATGNLVGVIYTCPNDPNEGKANADPAKYSLAGHALIKNLTPARYDVYAHPGAEREGAGEIWWQTETLEGTPAQDAFTGIREPVYFQEFGPPGFHTTIGFVNPAHVTAYATANKLTGSRTITGHVTNQHMSHPADVTLWDSGSYDLLNATTCQVALNSQSGTGPSIAIAQCDADGNFTLSKVPPGSYELAVWDQWLDQIIQTQAVTVGTTDVALGNIPVLSWFTQHDQNIFMDLNKDGIYESGEPGLSNLLMTVRFRNGAISSQTLSDSNGNGILAELFPLFNWYVSEADTTRFKQTGVNTFVDAGGKVDTNGLTNSTYAACPGGTNCTTNVVQTPGAYSYGIQSFISQRNLINWGRTPYAAKENGGIQGHVVYSSTRPFDDQRYNVQTIWEPLVPRVTVNLYHQKTLADGTKTLELVDSTLTSSWDDWANLVNGSDGKNYILGADQVLRDPVTGVPASTTGATPVTAGAQVNMQCPGQLPGPTSGAPPYDLTKVDPFTNYTLNNDQFRCYDGFHNWNQVQPAPYDGRYQFPSAAYIAAHPLSAAQQTAGQTLVSLPVGQYVVEAVTPPGYEVVKEEDKNILIGDAFIAPVTQQFGPLASIFILPDQATLNNANPFNPSTGDLGFQSNPTSNLGVTASKISFPECVGNTHRVPDYLSLFPAAQQVSPFAGMDRPLCDRKLVSVEDQMQVNANFFVFTEVPVAANNTGIILDDASSEYNQAAPDFGEKASVPFVPVSTKDFNGREISRTYSDQWGAYNMMLPSSWYVNPPTPSGYGPNMLINCMNDPGPIPATNALGQYIDVAGNVVATPALAKKITDPQYNPAYSNFCYTNPFMPSQTTYLDTPVLPIAAFASGYNPPDCAYPDATPAILRVDSSAGFGPYLTRNGGTLTITALGDQQVQNPNYAGPFATTGPASLRTLLRHYGFGTRGAGSQVTIGGVPMTIASWNDATITVNVPRNTATGELVITAANGKVSVDTVTVTVENKAPVRVQGASGATIQAAIDAATPGDLILVDAGTYNELVIMWKPVRLQGVGAAAVIINAAKYPTSKLEVWRPMINAMFGIDTNTGNAATNAQVDPLPGQEITGGIVLLEPSVLGTEEGAGITVLAKGFRADGVTPLTNSNRDCRFSSTTVAFDLVNGANTVPQPGLSNFLCAPSRIDGVSVTGGDAGGGIYVNGWAHNLEIANNRVYGNAGSLNGGVRIGVPYLEIPGYVGQSENAEGLLTGRPTLIEGDIAGFGYDQSVRIHHNAITKNGVIEGTTGQGGAGGGVSICTGSDGYSVDHNWICGNYSQSDGGGIGHLGFSQNGTIAYNQILFNQSFQQTNSTHGGGIFVGGEPTLALQTASLGTGNVTIDANIIRGNFAESGQGGGIRLQQVNGADVQAYPRNFEAWSKVTVTNNIIDNNVAAWVGGGISMSDVLNVSALINNTVASNDSTGTAGVLLTGTGETATTTGTGRPGPAGIASEPTSQQLLNAISSSATNPVRQANLIAKPTLENNIVWHNRSFYYKVEAGQAALCSSNDSINGCTQLPAQSTTGQCTGNPAFWDLGVLGNTSATPSTNANLRLNPIYSVLTSTNGYGSNATTHNSSSDPLLLDLYCNGSRVTPEFPAVINPPSIKAMQVAATTDEGNNYVSVRYGPLYLNKPTSSAGTGYAIFGDYHIAATSPAVNSGSSEDAPNHDIDAQVRPQGAGFDIGADEVPSAGSAGQLSAVPAQIDFGQQQVGIAPTFYPPQSVTLTNNGNAAVTGGIAIAITGGNGDFAIVNNNCGAQLAAKASCTFGIQFSPSAYTTRTATVTINASGNPQLSIQLFGTGTNPAQSVLPTALAFTSQLVNTTSVSQPVVVSNTGFGPLTVTGISLNGTNAPRYAQTNNCLATPIPAGGSCTVNVTFTPNAAGTVAATMRVNFQTNTLPATTQVVNLSGTGTAATLTQSPLAFGTVPPADPVLTAQIDNGAGDGNLTITSVTVTSGNAYFTIAAGTTCTAGAIVAAGNNCDVNVLFTQSPANSLTNRTGNVRIVTSAGIFNVPLSGN
jgi:hypothetical protein